MSTRIGIIGVGAIGGVVGGMLTSLLLTRYLMPVLYTLYGNREPSADAGSMAH